ncbi:hypothetical protein WJX74_009721 [Apatococcus lobatus]|uniref:Uncharacterized protein n=1 Tax=Apatococcus lobatus TaxID=904363 RepID=A0AAW1QVQ9_9CHLO
MLLAQSIHRPDLRHSLCPLSRLSSRPGSQIVRSQPKAASRRPSRCQAAGLDFDALLFDCDGVLCDTEAEGHRVAFNQAFQQKGLEVTWPLHLYGELLETGGGKERMTRHFTDLEKNGEGPFSSKGEGDRQALVKELHLLKTDIFMEMVEGGAMPLRPGILRLVKEANDVGLKIAVCSTSNEKAVSKIVEVLILPSVKANIQVFAGDVVPKKKPDPAIYNLAAKELGLEPSRCVVVEDSFIGLKAAKAAGMRCIVTRSSYTKSEDFQAADAVVDELGATEGIALQDLTVSGLAKLRQ